MDGREENQLANKLKNNFDKYMQFMYVVNISKDVDIMSNHNVKEMAQEVINESLALDDKWIDTYFGSKANMDKFHSIIKQNDAKALTLYSVWYKHGCCPITNEIFTAVDVEYQALLNEKVAIASKTVEITTTTRNIAKVIIFTVGIGVGLYIAKYLRK